MSETKTVSPLRQRMIEDMAARKLNPHTQRSHIYSCKRRTSSAVAVSGERLSQAANRSLRPFDCRMRMIICSLSCSRHGDEPEGARDVDPLLWLRAAGQRGGAAAGGRHRRQF